MIPQFCLFLLVLLQFLKGSLFEEHQQLQRLYRTLKTFNNQEKVLEPFSSSNNRSPQPQPASTLAAQNRKQWSELLPTKGTTPNIWKKPLEELEVHKGNIHPSEVYLITPVKKDGWLEDEGFRSLFKGFCC